MMHDAQNRRMVAKTLRLEKEWERVQQGVTQEEIVELEEELRRQRPMYRVKFMGIWDMTPEPKTK